jgi:hypothetical protein
MTDTERLDWLEQQSGYALVNDDFGRWAFVVDGMQNIPTKKMGDIVTTFFINKKDWKDSIRQAIDYTMRKRAKNYNLMRTKE